jgi:nicotinate-nucleotide adenylyltransferase
LAEWVIENTDLDELWFMVSPNNPLKEAGSLAPEEERLAAVREAIRDIPGLKASDFEFSLPRPSYTANTLRALQKAYPQHAFTLVIGEDNLAIFDRWREYEYIFANFRIFVYPRHTQESTEYRVQNTDSIIFLKDAPYFDISSTELRSRK